MQKGKIAIPSRSEAGLHGQRSEHFGHCSHFTLIEVDNGTVTSVTTLANDPHQAGGCLTPVMHLKNNGVDRLIVSGMGAGPFKRFSEVGIKVFFAEQNRFPDVQSAVAALVADILPEMHARQLCKGSGNCHHPNGAVH